MRHVIHSLVIISLILSAVVALAQQPGTGVPPFSSFQSGGFDAINRQNLNVLFSIPVVSTQGRGLNLSMSLTYNSLIWQKNGSAWSRVVDSDGAPTWGWSRQAPGGTPQYKFAWHRCVNDQGQNTNNGHYSNYKYVEDSGTVHSFGVDFEVNPDYPECADGAPQTGYATDGSGYFLDATDPAFPTVHSPAGLGTSIDGPLKDANGNFITSSVTTWETDWADTLGRTGLKIISQTSPMATLYQYQDSNGTWQTITMNLTSTDIKTNFGCSGTNEYTGTSIYLPTSIDLPNGTHYYITYEDTPGYSGYKTGRLQRITLPQVGYYQYSYGSTNDGINCSDGTVVSLSRVINDGTTSSTWGYSRAQVSGTTNWATTVTAPALSYDSSVSNQSVYTFNSTGQELEQDMYQGAAGGTLLKRVTTSWYGAYPNEVATTMGSQTSKVDYWFDSYGNVTEVNEFDWGASSPIRTTKLAYKNDPNVQSDQPYIDRNLVSLVKEKVVYAGWSSNGTPMYRMAILYDESTPANVTGAAGHDDTNFGIGFNVRGNPTSVKVYKTPTGSGSDPKITTYAYNTLGNVTWSKDPGTHETTYTYSSDYAYAYITDIENALGQHQQFEYYAPTGLLKSAKDQNDINASRLGRRYSYDALGRPYEVYSPDGGYAVYSYGDTGTLYARVSTQIDASHWADTYVQFDALGREYRKLVHNGESWPAPDWNTIDTCYDALGRKSIVTYPFQNWDFGTPGSCTTSGDRFVYDALGRVKTVTHSDDSSTVTSSYTDNATMVTDEAGRSRKMITDALGRLTSVVEPNPSTGSLTTSAFSTYYTYNALGNLLSVNQQGDGSGTARNRSFSYDSLARLTSETNPESGTTTYVYDSDPSFCAYSSSGNLVRRTDARGTSTCFTYDVLNRLLAKSYSDQTSVSFTYDESSIWGHSPQNPVGRLTRVQTSDSASAAVFSYDPVGRNIVQWLCPPNCGTGGIQMTTTYDGTGNLAALTYPSGRTVNFTYNVASLPISATDADGTHYASSATYAATGALLGLVNGSAPGGVTRSYTYNSRLQTASIAATTSGGQILGLTYDYGTQNNGNIQQIANTLNSGRTQTFTYDYLNRLASAYSNNSSGVESWGNSYTYDPWGDLLEKSSYTNRVNYESFSAAVDTSHPNRLTGYTYDAAGNLTQSGSSSFAYDAEARLASGGGATYTYDAMGQRVRKDYGSATAEYVYFGGKVIAERNPQIALSSGMLSQSGLTAFNAGAIVDGNTGSQGWHTDSAVAGAWLEVDLGSARAITSARIFAATSGYAGAYNVQYSDDNSAWTTAASINPSSQGWNEVQWNGVGTHRYWRLYLTNTPGGGAWLNELQLGTWTDYVYFGGQRVASRKDDGNTYYYLSDHLGTSRMIAKADGTVCYEAVYYPWGAEQNVFSNDCAQNYKFTGMEHDSETNLDHTWFRQNSPVMSRWLTPDPAGLAAVDLSNPQSLNRYAYVMNSPTTFVDPFGLFVAPGDPCPAGYHPVRDDQFGTVCYPNSGGGGGFSDSQIDAINNFLACAMGIIDCGSHPPLLIEYGTGEITMNIRAIQNCRQYSNVGDNLAKMNKEGKISFDAGLGEYGRYFALSDVIHLAPDVFTEQPTTLLHEYAHRTQAINLGADRSRVLGWLNLRVFGSAMGFTDKLIANALYPNAAIPSQGVAENAAQAFAIKVAQTCGIPQ